MATQIRRAVAIVILAAIVSGGGYAAYRYWWTNQSAPDRITLYGNIDIREADLAFNVPGMVDAMLVEEGDVVEKGQVLAKQDTGIYQAEVDVAKAQVDVQQVGLERLLAGSRPEEIKAARENARSTAANLDDAEATLRRTRNLVAKGFATQQQLDHDQAQVNSLRAQLTSIQQALALAIKGPRQEDIAAARAQLKAAEATLQRALETLHFTQLRAKERGVVKTRIVEPGAVVTANAPVYTIAISDPVWVRTYIAEPDLGRIHPGMKAQVMTDTASGKPHEGWVGFISPVAEFTPKSVQTPQNRTSLVYRLRVYVKNPDNSLRQGMPVTVVLDTAAEKPSDGKSASH